MQRVVDDIELDKVFVNITIAGWFIVGERCFTVLAACTYTAIVGRCFPIGLNSVNPEIEVCFLLGNIVEIPGDFDFLRLIHILSEMEADAWRGADDALTENTTGQWLWVCRYHIPVVQPFIGKKHHFIAVLTSP